METKIRQQIVGGLFLSCVAFGICLGGWEVHRLWSRHDVADQTKLKSEKQWAIRRVQTSSFGTIEMRTTAASEFFGEQSVIGTCDWSGYPLWHGSFKNPNWWSSIKGSDGFRVTCDTDATHGKDTDDMTFTYDWSSDWGVTAMSWGYTPDYSGY